MNRIPAGRECATNGKRIRPGGLAAGRVGYLPIDRKNYRAPVREDPWADGNAKAHEQAPAISLIAGARGGRAAHLHGAPVELVDTMGGTH